MNWGQGKDINDNLTRLFKKHIEYEAYILVLSSTSVLSTKLATKQQFWENMTCRQRFCYVDMINVLFWKRKDTFKNQNIVKNKPSKRLDCLQKARCQASAAACLTLSPPLFTQPVPMIRRVTQSLDFGQNVTAFDFLTIVLSTVVAVEMKFDPTCRQRNLSSTTALIFSFSFPHGRGPLAYLKSYGQLQPKDQTTLGKIFIGYI